MFLDYDKFSLCECQLPVHICFHYLVTSIEIFKMKVAKAFWELIGMTQASKYFSLVISFCGDEEL